MIGIILYFNRLNGLNRQTELLLIGYLLLALLDSLGGLGGGLIAFGYFFA
jgi:hypothetical protein